MSSEVLFFALRFVGFIISSIAFFAAGNVIFHNIVWEDFFEERNELNGRQLTAVILLLTGAFSESFLVTESVINNSNEWLGAKISWYVFTCFFMTFLPFMLGVLEEDKARDELRKKIKPIPEVLGILTGISAAAFTGFMVFGFILCVFSASGLG